MDAAYSWSDGCCVWNDPTDRMQGTPALSLLVIAEMCRGQASSRVLQRPPLGQFEAPSPHGTLIPTGHYLGPMNIEQEILALRTEAQVTRYWRKIRKVDQAHRGLNTIDSLDNLNLKKTILMIRHHGFPKGNMTPNLVLTHQRSAYVREHYFPIFHEAYKAAEADSFWFLPNVRGLHRGRYARYIVQPTASNYISVLDRLSEWIPAEVRYDHSPFDSLFTTYLRDVEHIISTEPV